MAVFENTGSLFDADTPALLQGVNIKGLMGAGIAVGFRERWPLMYEKYKELCAAGELQPGGLFVWDGGDQVVYNAASQDLPGKHARLEWLEESVAAALADAAERGFPELSMPRVGCGIAGLTWAEVKPVLEKLSDDAGLTIQVWARAEDWFRS
jgi:O-acetyl-ADP-ribose deacetylase (regulator of RNase III)